MALFDAIMAGAAGYPLKQMRGAGLIGAVRTVAAGLMRLDNRTGGADRDWPGDGRRSVREHVGAARPPQVLGLVRADRFEGLPDRLS